MPIHARPNHLRRDICERELAVLLPVANLRIMIVGDGGARSLIGVCLKQQRVCPFSPSASQASLQTSIFKIRNRTIGAAMSIIEKSDVKNHLSSRYRTKIHLCPPVSQSEAAGVSVAESDALKAKPSRFAEDFVTEHSSSHAAVAPTEQVTDSSSRQKPIVSKSAQA